MTVIEILSCDVSHYPYCNHLNTSVSLVSLLTPPFPVEDIMNALIDSVWAVISVIA